MSTFVETNHISNIYDFSPAVKNLYEVAIYNTSTSISKSEKSDTYQNNINNNNATILHATSVTLPSDTLKLERNSVTKNFTLGDNGGYTWNDTLTIVWRENSNWSIREYHQRWIGAFYDKEKDKYQSVTSSSSVEDRYRKFKITLPNSKVVWCIDVIPQGPWNLDLAWGNSPSIVTYSIVYNVGYWYWEGEES